jgi:hypothetical protein
MAMATCLVYTLNQLPKIATHKLCSFLMSGHNFCHSIHDSEFVKDRIP